MSGQNSNSFLEFYGAKDIKIKNFNNSAQCKKGSVRFVLNRFPLAQYFCVEVYPNGISPDYQEYVSVNISKVSSNDTDSSTKDNVHLSWTLSVIDVNGSGRCYRSLAKENTAGLLYNENIPDFLKRSFLTSLDDELLPEDVLTIRCEMFGVNYSSVSGGYKHFFEKEKENSDLNPLGNLSTDISINHGKVRISIELKKIAISTIYLFLHLISTAKMNAASKESMENMLANDDAHDEIRQTYLSSSKLFRVHLILKEFCRKSMNNDKYAVIGNFMHLINRKSNYDDATQMTTQTTSGPTNDESKWFDGLLEEVRLLSHKDEKTERTTEAYQPSDLLLNLLIESLANIIDKPDEIVQRMLEEPEFDRISKNISEERRETQLLSGSSNDEGKSFSEKVGRKCSLSRKDGENERITVTDQPVGFQMGPIIEKVKGSLKNINETMQHILEEREFDRRSKNVCEKRKECKSESTQMKETVQIRQTGEFSLSHKDGESERIAETDQPVGFEMEPFIERGKGFFENFNEIKWNLLEELGFDKGSKKECEERGRKRQRTQMTKKECEERGRKRQRTQMTSGTANDEGKCFLNNTEAESEGTTETGGNLFVKLSEAMIPLLLEVERLMRTKNMREDKECKGEITAHTKDALLEEYMIRTYRQIIELISEIWKEEKIVNPTSKLLLRFCPTFDLKADLPSEMKMKYIVNYAEKALRSLMREVNVFDNDSTAKNQTTWNFYFETMDGITFIIPFENDRETLGSKLISSSVVFQRMLEGPMREKFEGRAKLGNIEGDTFIHFLYFLQRKDIKPETFSELRNIYKLADMYHVQELMLLCDEQMRSFFPPNNINEAEELACLNSDIHLVELESFNVQNAHPVSEPNEGVEILLDEQSTSLDAQTEELKIDFAFYQ